MYFGMSNTEKKNFKNKMKRYLKKLEPYGGEWYEYDYALADVLV